MRAGHLLGENTTQTRDTGALLTRPNWTALFPLLNMNTPSSTEPGTVL